MRKVTSSRIGGSSRLDISATRRLQQDYLRLCRDPIPYIQAEPLPENILEWHYIVRGPEDSPYATGIYHGRLVFPREFPFKPPSIFMITPNGRFQVNTRLCLSISDFHPDTWNPAWTVSTILTGLLSFMLENSPTLGSLDTSTEVRRDFAMRSLAFNLQNSTFVTLFPNVVEEIKSELARRENALTVHSRVHESYAESSVLDEETQRVALRNLTLFGSEEETEVPHAGVYGGRHHAGRGVLSTYNIFLLIAVTAFALVVRFVLLSLTV